MTAAPVAFPIERRRLANGLELVLQPDTRLPLVTVNLWYHVGSKNETPGKTGLAHLFEHMLFQGSAHVETNGHFTHLQKVGGVANGSTWYDRTNYYETVPSQHLELALWLEADRMGFLLPALTAEKLANQREVVINERRQRVDNQPYGRAFETLHELLYPPGHPYRWPVIGTLEDIESATLDDVREFFTLHYRPDNAVLTLAGDFEIPRAVELAERYFGDIPSGPPAPPLSLSGEELRGERRAILEDDVELPRVYIAYRMPGYASRDWVVADLLATALARGKSSPMYRDLVHQRQIAQDVSTGALPTELEAAWLAIATGRPGTDPEVLLREVDAHLDRAAHSPPSEADLERSRNGVVTAYVEHLQSLEERADLLAQSHTFLGDAGAYADRLRAYSEVSAAEIQGFAARVLDAERRAVVTVVPRSRR